MPNRACDDLCGAPKGRVLFGERLVPTRLIETMSDKPREMRSRSSKTVIGVVILLAAILGAVVFWRSSDRLNGPSPTASVQPAGQSQTLSPASASPPADDAETKQALSALGKTIKDIQASQQQLADRLDEIQKQLSAEHGDQKLLSEQVGALSGRVDSLATSSATVSTGALGPAKKKR